MKTIKILFIMIIAATVSACGSNFEWFPKVSDTTGPTVTATVGGIAFANNSSTHVPSLPASVTFSTTEAATIYYTTNGDTPTTSSTAVVTSANSAAGPSISITNTILKFFGIDSLSNASAIQSGTVKSP